MEQQKYEAHMKDVANWNLRKQLAESESLASDIRFSLSHEVAALQSTLDGFLFYFGCWIVVT